MDNDPEQVVVLAEHHNTREHERQATVYKLNVNNGKTKEMAKDELTSVYNNPL